MGHRGVLEIDRADPFAAGLDHVLGPVGDLDVAIGVEPGDVAGRKPAVGVEHIAALAAEIAGGDPRAAHLQVAGLTAAGRDFGPILADNAQLDAAHGAALQHLDIHLLVDRQVAVLGQKVADGGDRARLAHAPGLDDEDADAMELLDDGTGRRGTTDDNPLERQTRRICRWIGFQVLEEAHPDCRHAEAESAVLLDGKLVEVLAIQMRSRQHQLGAAQGGGIGHAPGIHMEKRDGEQGAVGAAQLQTISLTDQQRV